MEKCCVCKKKVWPWQQSNISFSPIHRKCHEKMISEEFQKNVCSKIEVIRELALFKDETGIEPNIFA
jgi:hypothetical protein